MKKSNRKYRIKSKFRFITFLVIVLGLAAGAIGYATGVTGFGISTALTVKDEPVKVEVFAGDTIWDIADEYKSRDKDIRKAVYQICRLNDLEDGHIEAGMMIEIPENL